MTDMLRYPALEFGVRDAAHLVEWQEHYRLDDDRIAAGLGTRLEARLADLLDVAVAAYVTDRLRPRRPKRGERDGRWWSRELAMTVAVRDVDFWRSPEVTTRLQALLGWLTDDRWSCGFVAHPRHRRYSETQERLFPDEVAQPAQAALLSGGLDSLLGAERDLRADGGDLLLVSAGTHSRLMAAQAATGRGLAAFSRRRVRQFIVPVGLRASARALPEAGREESQRTRAFVFLAFGAVVAASAELSELRVYENGVGALNLPLTQAQRGAMNTRAMRPETLSRMGALLELVLERPFSIVNPNFWFTKAELCRDAPAHLEPLMAKSVSCDTGLTRRVASPLCGACTSCVLRRQALLAAVLTDVDRKDVERMEGDALRSRPEHARPAVLAMLAQALDLDLALSTDEPWRELVRLYPELASARRAIDAQTALLVDLLSRYVDDWRAVDLPVVDRFLGVPGLAP